MATLDFAFLAGSARVDADHTLSGLGIGFTHVLVSNLPAPASFAVAGMVWVTPEDQGAVDLVLTLIGAGEAYEVNLDTTIVVPEGEPVLEGRQAVMFNAAVTMPLVVTGVYRVVVRLGGTPVKTLTFEAADESLGDEGVGS